MRVRIPEGYRLTDSDRARSVFTRVGSPHQITLFTAEFGNLESFNPAQEAELFEHLRKRLGKNPRVALGETRMAGRKARRLRASGSRQGAPWGLGACYSLKGGQAYGVEVLYPLSASPEGELILDQLLHSLEWSEIDRG